MFCSGNWVFLNATNIKTIYPFPKLLHCCLGPFIVEQQVGPLVYHLKLLHMIKKLYSMFNVIKLFATLDNLIPGKKPRPLLLPVVIDRKEK